jgi:hypothetical protein
VHYSNAKIYNYEGTLSWLMKFVRRPLKPKPSHRFTNLLARITQEEDGYTVHVRLYSQAAPQNDARGEEWADSLEAASMMVESLANEFAILAAQIKIEILMQDSRAGTRH